MYNSPALDIAIALVFIFLLYSLLATSVQEAVATALGMRAKMLKKSIVENMLADTPNLSRLSGIRKDILLRIQGLLVIFRLRKKQETNSLGNRFYAHPIIKNYGESRIYPLPAYIPKSNFSSVLIDIFLKDFNDNSLGIAQMNLDQGSMTGDLQSIKADLERLQDAYKIKELLRYHIQAYATDVNYKHFIECETCQILSMHLRNSQYDLAAFSHHLEDWFDDSMHRVTGWYKRQTQFILFAIGLFIAFAFNVDVIDIAGRLSTDKDARDKMVALAVKAAESYKDDPRVQQARSDIAKSGKVSDSVLTSLEDLKKEYDSHLDDAKRMMNKDIAEANNLLTVGWAGYGKDDFKFLEKVKNDDGWNLYFWKVGGYKHYWQPSQTDAVKNEMILYKEKKKLAIDSLLRVMNKPSTNQIEKRRLKKELIDTKTRFDYKADSVQYAAFYNKVIEKKRKSMKVKYMLYSIGPKKFLGFIIFAFGICLGAPFWFDLLNKLVKLRGANKNGASGDGNSGKASVRDDSAQTQPIAITVNNQSTGEEAVG